MFYSTMLPPWWRRVLAWGLGRRFTSDPGILALGTLAPGPGGHEPILSPEQVARDLDLALEVGARAVVLYRLSGLTPQHLAVIHRYAAATPAPTGPWHRPERPDASAALSVWGSASAWPGAARPFASGWSSRTGADLEVEFSGGETMGTVGTASTGSVLARRPVRGHHRRLLWWISRWALPLYHLHLLWLVSPRFLVLTHRGRRTGALHRTCVLVIHEDRHTGELLVVAGDRHADWYRNILAASPTEVAVGHRRFRPAMRLVGREELLRRLVTCRREHRPTARVQAAFFGWPWPATPAQLGALADRLGGVGLRPTRPEEL